MSYVRPYNHHVLVGNWSEDVELEQEKMKDFIDRRDKGQLLIQQHHDLIKSAYQTVSLGVSRDGKVHFEDKVMVVNPSDIDQTRKDTSVAAGLLEGEIQTVYGFASTDPVARNVFVITSCDGSPPGETLKYGQSFYLRTFCGNMYLQSDNSPYIGAARKSRHCFLRLVREPSYLCEFRAVALSPEYRMELEFADVSSNQKVLITHVKTNQALRLESEHIVRHFFGREYELSCHTLLDAHKFEHNTNHFIITMQKPGDSFQPVIPPVADPDDCLREIGKFEAPHCAECAKN